MEWEDLPFTIETIIKSNSVSVIERNLYFYRYREDSLTRQVSCTIKRFIFELCFKIGK